MGRLTLIIFACIVIFAGWPMQAVSEEHDCSGHSPRNNQRYTTTDVNLRSWSSTSADILATLPEGEIVFAYQNSGGWSRVNVASLNVTGYVATRYLSEACVPGGGLSRSLLSRANISAILRSQSLSRYSGSCPCPYNYDRGGRRCGARSAYSRPGGASPLCYPRDVTTNMIQSFISSRP